MKKVYLFILLILPLALLTGCSNKDYSSNISDLELENQQLKSDIDDLNSTVSDLEYRIEELENSIEYLEGGGIDDFVTDSSAIADLEDEIRNIKNNLY